MRLYIDLCCWNRPFDDVSQARVRAEAAALEVILERIRQGADTLLWSAFLEVELVATPDSRRQDWINQQKGLASQLITATADIEARAQTLVQNGMKALDALHLAAAECSAEALLTVDDRFFRQAKRLSPGLRVYNPVDYCDEVNRASNP